MASWPVELYTVGVRCVRARETTVDGRSFSAGACFSIFDNRRYLIAKCTLSPTPGIPQRRNTGTTMHEMRDSVGSVSLGSSPSRNTLGPLQGESGEYARVGCAIITLNRQFITTPVCKHIRQSQAGVHCGAIEWFLSTCLLDLTCCFVMIGEALRAP